MRKKTPCTFPWISNDNTSAAIAHAAEKSSRTATANLRRMHEERRSCFGARAVLGGSLPALFKLARSLDVACQRYATLSLCNLSCGEHKAKVVLFYRK